MKRILQREQKAEILSADVTSFGRPTLIVFTATDCLLQSDLRQFLSIIDYVLSVLLHWAFSRVILFRCVQDQYSFIHDALVEFIRSGGETEVKDINVSQYIRQLTAVDENGSSLVQKQYQVCGTSFSYYLVMAFDEMVAVGCGGTTRCVKLNRQYRV